MSMRRRALLMRRVISSYVGPPLRSNWMALPPAKGVFAMRSSCWRMRSMAPRGSALALARAMSLSTDGAVAQPARRAAPAINSIPKRTPASNASGASGKRRPRQKVLLRRRLAIAARACASIDAFEMPDDLRILVRCAGLAFGAGQTRGAVIPGALICRLMARVGNGIGNDGDAVGGGIGFVPRPEHGPGPGPMRLGLRLLIVLIRRGGGVRSGGGRRRG